MKMSINKSGSNNVHPNPDHKAEPDRYPNHNPTPTPLKVIAAISGVWVAPHIRLSWPE